MRTALRPLHFLAFGEARLCSLLLRLKSSFPVEIEPVPPLTCLSGDPGAI
jgi:hypothetical protein